MTQITLKDVVKQFGHVVAVNKSNLEIQDGEFFALLGPSGCGKTTTLRLIAGLEKPTAGRILIGDRDVTDLPPRERDVAMVFQDYALYPHMTIMENVGYPLKVRGVKRSETEQRVREVAGSLRLSDLLARRPSQVSGGQQQRAAVARAVVHKPQVFLFDEPLSNLDAMLRLEARGFLKHLQNELGITTVYVTHDQAEAMALADRMAIMSEGDILQIGSPLEVYRRPQTTFVAAFIGNPPMNLLRGHLKIDAAGPRFQGAGFELDLAAQAGPHRSAVSRFADGDAATLGVRPEHLSFCASDAPLAIAAQVYAVQPLGAECLVVLQVGESTVAVRLFTDETPALAGPVWIAPDPAHLFLYDAAGKLVV